METRIVITLSLKENERMLQYVTDEYNGITIIESSQHTHSDGRPFIVMIISCKKGNEQKLFEAGYRCGFARGLNYHNE